MFYDFSAGNADLAKLCRDADLWSGPGLANFIAKLAKVPLMHQPGDAWTYGVNQDGVEVTTDLGQLSMPSSVGQFGWYGAATTYCQIDPKEKIVAIALAQHFPFNQHTFFAAFQTGYYQALK